MKVKNEIYDLISTGIMQTGFDYSLNVINNSDKHIGHSGHDGGGESHFKVDIVSD